MEDRARKYLRTIFEYNSSPSYLVLECTGVQERASGKQNLLMRIKKVILN